MIAPTRTENQLRAEIERLAAEIDQEIRERRMGMPVYDIKVDVLMRVHERLTAALNGQREISYVPLSDRSN